MARDPQATIGGQTVEVVTAVPQGRPEAAPASADASRVAGIWLDGYVPRDAEILTTWRRDAGTRFPAHLWLDDGVWACEVLITGLEWGTRPGFARLQAQSLGHVTRESHQDTPPMRTSTPAA